MKSVFRLRILLLSLFVGGSLLAQKIDNDTTLIKRPRYFGLFFGTLQFTQADHFLYQAEPQIMIDDQVLQLKVEDAIQGGFFFTHPFLNRMEWDLGFGVFSFKRETKWMRVTAVSTGPTPMILSSQTWTNKKNLVVTELRSHFSYNLIQRDNYSILFGAGGWLASNTMKAAYNPGSVGVEGNITAYYRYNKKSYVQVHLSPGWMKNGYYINATIGICYQSQRTMRVHPSHYYVRTYDEND